MGSASRVLPGYPVFHSIKIAGAGAVKMHEACFGDAALPLAGDPGSQYVEIPCDCQPQRVLETPDKLSANSG